MRLPTMVIAATLVCFAASGCGGGDTQPKQTDVVIGSVMLDATSINMLAGETRSVQAKLFSPGGFIINGLAPTWTSSDLTRATVSSNGLVTALSVGTAVVTATRGGQSASLAVTITAVASCSDATINAPILAVGEVATLTSDQKS